MKNITMTHNHAQICERIQHDLDRVIDSLAPGYHTVTENTRCLFELVTPPALTITEDDHCFYVLARVPNISRHDLDVQINGHDLVISGNLDIEITCDREDEMLGEKYQRASITFERSIVIPSTVDRHGVKANIRNGCLTVALPKTETLSEQTHMIDVSNN